MLPYIQVNPQNVGKSYVRIWIKVVVFHFYLSRLPGQEQKGHGTDRYYDRFV